eukprot:3528151-Amphidinium_carterae.1
MKEIEAHEASLPGLGFILDVEDGASLPTVVNGAVNSAESRFIQRESVAVHWKQSSARHTENQMSTSVKPRRCHI